MVDIIKGADKSIIVRLNSRVTGDPFDLTGIDRIKACFIKKSGTSALSLFYLPRTANITNGSDIIASIDVTDIAEGMPVTGTGIPVGATVLKTPSSTTSPTAANTIKISSNATATTTGVSLVIGDIAIVSALLGKIRILLSEAQTDLLKAGTGLNFEVSTVLDGYTRTVQFLKSLNVIERIC